MEIKKLHCLIIAIVAIVSFSFLSCEKADYSDTQLMKASELEASTNDLNASQSDEGLIQTRARNINWIEKNYISNLSNWYEVVNASKSGSNTFSFKVNLKEWTMNYLEVYVKIYSPSGVTSYEQMTRNGYVFNYQAQFWETGTYYYRYFVRLNPNKSELTKLHSDSKSFNLYANIPSVGDNYDSENYEFARYNCTSWVAQKVNEMWETSHAFNNEAFVRTLGHAYNWKSVLEDSGYKISHTPLPGDIAWWRSIGTPQTNPLGFDANGNPYGHVAFVHKVYSDKSIEITEYNWSPPHAYHYVARIYPSQSRYPDSFIHVQFQK